MESECATINKDEYLVFGYMRFIENELKLNVTTIIDLCLQFYFLPYNDSSGTVSDASSSEYESSDSLSYSESNEDEISKLEKKNQRAIKKLRLYHEVAIYVERTGSKQFNGKYVFSVTTEEGYPTFQHVDNKYLLIKQNEDDMRWEFINTANKQIFYYADSDQEFPPGGGWSKAEFGNLPNPGVRLLQIKASNLC
eukprot:85783_1